MKNEELRDYVSQFFLCSKLKLFDVIIFEGVKKFLLYIALGLFISTTVTACKAKHCAALEDGMEGYDAKKVKKRRGRQEGLGNNMRIR